MQKKPTTGRLIQIQADGSTKVIAQDKPFSRLQEIKKEWIRYGFKKDNLKITY